MTAQDALPLGISTRQTVGSLWGGQRDRKYEQESPKGQCVLLPALWLGCPFYPYPHTLGIAHLGLDSEAAGAWGWASGIGCSSAELVAPGWGSETFLWVPVPHHLLTAVALTAGSLHPSPGGLACSSVTGPRTHPAAAPSPGNLPWQPHLLDYSTKTAPLEPAWEGARDPRPKTCPGSDWLAGYLPPPGRAEWECWVALGRSPGLLGLSEPLRTSQNMDPGEPWRSEWTLPSPWFTSDGEDMAGGGGQVNSEACTHLSACCCRCHAWKEGQRCSCSAAGWGLGCVSQKMNREGV